MYKAAVLVLLSVGLAMAQSPKYKVGNAATAGDIAQRDHFVSPDGKGLPAGTGTASEGKLVYDRRCATCHGAEGKGKEEVALVGGQGTLATPKPLKTVGSYWPYSTTLFDYIRRAMPYVAPQSLTPDEIYSVSAYILFLNGVIGETDEMNATTLPRVKMPNRDNFVSAYTEPKHPIR